MGKLLFFQYVDQPNWSFIDNTSVDVDEHFNIFMDKLLSARDATISIVSVADSPYKRSYLKWFNRSLWRLKESMRFLRDLHDCFPSNLYFSRTNKQN